MRKSIIAAALGALLAVAFAVPQFAFSTHTPANKAVASGSKVVKFAPGTNVELLRSTMRTSKPTDLLLEVNLECSILTQLVTGPSAEGGSDSAMARGDIRVWVEVDDKIVPINSTSQPPQDPDGQVVGNDTDKVTFCNRTYERKVTDTEEPEDGQDTIEDYIETKAAHSFSWVRLNAGSGVHSIVVKADLDAETAGDAVSEAYVGNRTLIVQPEKFANDATV